MSGQPGGFYFTVRDDPSQSLVELDVTWVSSVSCQGPRVSGCVDTLTIRQRYGAGIKDKFLTIWYIYRRADSNIFFLCCFSVYQPWTLHCSKIKKLKKKVSIQQRAGALSHSSKPFVGYTSNYNCCNDSRLNLQPY